MHFRVFKHKQINIEIRSENPGSVSGITEIVSQSRSIGIDIVVDYHISRELVSQLNYIQKLKERDRKSVV